MHALVEETKTVLFAAAKPAAAARSTVQCDGVARDPETAERRGDRGRPDRHVER